jgi:hypothetical protein
MKIRLIVKKIIFSSLDIIIAPLILVPLLILRFCRNKGITLFPNTLKSLDRIGIFPLHIHYYEPLIVPQRTIDKGKLTLKRTLQINFQIEKQISLIKSFNFKNELLGLEDKAIKNLPKYYYNNGSFESGDSEFYYSLIRHLKPKTIIEVGSGNSTLVAVNALEVNSREGKDNASLICIEPYGKQWLEKVENIQVVREKVEHVTVDFFKQLKENDILFIDSSHMIRPQGDVVFEILNVIPNLNPGVYIHVHDIFTPYDYCYEWLVNQRRFWNEQYLLEAYLIENKNVEVIASLNYLSHDYTELLASVFPHYRLRKGRDLGSFWLRKI